MGSCADGQKRQLNKPSRPQAFDGTAARPVMERAFTFAARKRWFRRADGHG
jgi:hypothetical protein